MRAGGGQVQRELPTFSIGRGPDLVVLPGLGFNHEPPRGVARVLEAVLIAQLARRHRVHWLGRPQGLPSGTTIGDFAAFTGTAIARRFGRPVPVLGFSTGGFIALQLALDHPDVVQRMVVVGAAGRLSSGAAVSERLWADHLAAGRIADAWRELAHDYTRSDVLTRILAAVFGLVGPWVTSPDTDDGVITARADVAFDVHDRLGEVRAPTLVVAGERDRTFEQEDLIAMVAAIPDCRVVRLRGTGHVGSMVHPVAVGRIDAFLRAPISPAPQLTDHRGRAES